MPDRRGFELPLLLVAGFRAIVDELHRELAARGHPLARPIHGFALQAIGDGITLSELGRRLGVSKQAAAKTLASLEAAGYARRVPNPDDRRSITIQPTTRGVEMLALSAAIFERIRADLAAEVGETRLELLEETLAAISSVRTVKLGDLPGWLR